MCVNAVLIQDKKSSSQSPQSTEVGGIGPAHTTTTYGVVVCCKMKWGAPAVCLAFCLVGVTAFNVGVLNSRRGAQRCPSAACTVDIVSPFEEQGRGVAVVGPLPLTAENVEAVLDEMRPYLINDGGNVALRDIDGGIVVLELQGACGTCPSSSMTMKMGLERGLLEKIPEIISVEQVSAEGVEISEDEIEDVLGEIRPFLKMAGGDVTLLSIDPGDLQPSCTLRLTGSGSALRSIKGEIIQRLRGRMPSLAGVLWEE